MAPEKVAPKARAHPARLRAVGSGLGSQLGSHSLAQGKATALRRETSGLNPGLATYQPGTLHPLVLTCKMEVMTAPNLLMFFGRRSR